MMEIPINLRSGELEALYAGSMTHFIRAVTIPWRKGRRALPDFLGGQGDQDDPECWGYAFDGPDHHGYMVLARGLNQRHDNGLISLRCPYGEPGDRLWVRESCRIWGDIQGGSVVEFRDGQHIDHKRGGCHRMGSAILCESSDLCDYEQMHTRWRSPLSMPRAAARTFLEVVDVQVRRLSSIRPEEYAQSGTTPEVGQILNRLSLKFPGSSNPWVWFNEVKRIHPC